MVAASDNRILDLPILSAKLLVQEGEVGLVLDLIDDAIDGNSEDRLFGAEIARFWSLLWRLLNVVNLPFRGRDVRGG